MEDTMNSNSSQPQQNASGSEGLGSSTKALIEQADQFLKATASMSGETVNSLRSKLTDSLSSARSELAHIQQMARERGEKALAVGRQHLQEKPLQTLACVALLGLFLGWLSTRSSRN